MARARGFTCGQRRGSILSWPHGAPIRIQTLGDRADLDMAALISKFGDGFVYVGRAWKMTGRGFTP
jgi:hypothetical protein